MYGLFQRQQQAYDERTVHSAKRPFFSSTQMMPLAAIPNNFYATFIKNKFTESNREISDEAIHFLLTWTRTHTYYTQTLCIIYMRLP